MARPRARIDAAGILPARRRRRPEAKGQASVMKLFAYGLSLALLAAVMAVVVTAAPVARGAPSEAQASRVIAIDPGHGGREPGAVYRGAGGRVEVIEKEVNLWISLFLADALREMGFTPILTRSTDTEVNVPRTDRNGDGRIDNDDDLQARVDVANDHGASLLISVHNNGATS